MLLQLSAKLAEMETYPSMISHVFCVPYCLFEIFYQECHNLILASNINVRSNYDSTFSSTQIDSCLMILEATVAVCRGQETASYFSHYASQ